MSRTLFEHISRSRIGVLIETTYPKHIAQTSCGFLRHSREGWVFAPNNQEIDAPTLQDMAAKLQKLNREPEFDEDVSTMTDVSECSETADATPCCGAFATCTRPCTPRGQQSYRDSIWNGFIDYRGDGGAIAALTPAEMYTLLANRGMAAKDIYALLGTTWVQEPLCAP